MDGGKFRDTMHSLNYGTVMEAAARDYMKEKMGEEARARAMGKARALDARDLCEVRERERKTMRRVARRPRVRAVETSCAKAMETKRCALTLSVFSS